MECAEKIKHRRRGDTEGARRCKPVRHEIALACGPPAFGRSDEPNKTGEYKWL